MATQRSVSRDGAQAEDRGLSSARTNLSQDEEKFIDSKGADWEKGVLEREDTNLSALPPYKTASLPLYGVEENGSGHYNAPVESPKDLVTEVIHARDDPTLNAWTFRVWFLGEQPDELYLNPVADVQRHWSLHLWRFARHNLLFQTADGFRLDCVPWCDQLCSRRDYGNCHSQERHGGKISEPSSCMLHH
jgi:hypothetical protein